MDAVILKNGLAVKINSQLKNYSLSGFGYSVSGFVLEFKNQGITYRYYYSGNFKKEDQNKPGIAGYYDYDKFLKYKEYKNLVPFETLKLNKFEYNNFEIASPNDILDIEEVIYPSPYDSYFIDKISKFKIITRTNFLSSNYHIAVPENSEEGLITSVDLDRELDNTVAGKFYHNNLSQTIRENSEVVEQFAEIVTLIAFKISFIIRDVFPLLQAGGNSDVNNLINNLLSQWQNQNLLPSQPIAEEFLLYYSMVSNFYTSCIERRDTLTQASADEKILVLLKILPPQILSDSNLVSLQIKQKALKQLAEQSSIWNDDEELVIKIVNSIHITDQQEVNDFLGWLIDEKFPTGNKLPPYQETIYSLLYKKIQNYSSIVKMIPELFGNQSFSKDNKTRFVYAILGLWSESKYNPYKNTDGQGNPDYTLFDNGTYDYDQNYKHYALLNYKSEKNIIGVYDDVYTFSFSPWGNGIYYVIDEKGVWIAGDIMHTYQPITLLYYPSETDTSIQLPEKDGELNGVIPLFFLMYVDQHGDSEDFATKVGILVDVVTTISGIGNLAKLRHLRHLSKLGQVLVVIEGVQITAGVVSFLLNFVDGCNDSPFCKKLKTVLFFVEITALVTDPIAAYKTKKAAREVVEEGIENGWPSGMLDEITDGGVTTTPKQKIEELADIDIADYINNYIRESKKDLLTRIENENNFRKLTKQPPSLQLYYSNSQINEILTIGVGKGLSKEDSMGIIFQACRIRRDGYIAPLNVLKERLDNLVEVRRNGYPFTFDNLNDFTTYVHQKIHTTLDDFGFKKQDVYYTGSSVTSHQSIGDGPFDTDWAIEYTRNEIKTFIENLEKKWTEAALQGDVYKDGKILKANEATRKIKDMNDLYSKKSVIHKRYIIKITTNSSGQRELVTLEKHMEDFPISIKTDLTPVIKDVNAGYPRIKYNLN